MGRGILSGSMSYRELKTLKLELQMNFENDKDVEAIKEWMVKENYVLKDFEDGSIKKFLHSCDDSLQRTKTCFEKFCKGRYNLPELYNSRDPCSTQLQTAFSLANVASYRCGDDEIIMHMLDAPTLEKFNFYDVLKAFCIQTDYWIHKEHFLADGHIIIMDIKYITLRILPKVNVFYFQKFVVFLLESMPVRLKQIHVINCPSYYEKLFALIKSALPQEIIDMVAFHSTHEGLHKVIDKKCLPEEYGGEALSFKQKHRQWVNFIECDRNFFLNDSLWKCDPTKDLKSNCDYENMNGSFRTLAID